MQLGKELARRVIEDYRLEFPTDERAPQSLQAKLIRSGFLKPSKSSNPRVKFVSRLSHSLKIEVLLLSDELQMTELTEVMIEAVTAAISSCGITALEDALVYANVGDFPADPSYGSAVFLGDLEKLLKLLRKHLAYAVMLAAWKGKVGKLKKVDFGFLLTVHEDLATSVLANRNVVDRSHIVDQLKLFKLSPTNWARILHTAASFGSKDTILWLLQNRARPDEEFEAALQKRPRWSGRNKSVLLERAATLRLLNIPECGAVEYGMWRAMKDKTLEYSREADLACAQKLHPEIHAKFMMGMTIEGSVDGLLDPSALDSLAACDEYHSLLMKHRKCNAFAEELIAMVQAVKLAWEGGEPMCLSKKVASFVRLIRLSQGKDLDQEISIDTFLWLKKHGSVSLRAYKYENELPVFFACMDRADLMKDFLSDGRIIAIPESRLAAFAKITFDAFAVCMDSLALNWSMLVRVAALDLDPRVLEVILSRTNYKNFSARLVRGDSIKLLDLALSLKMPAPVLIDFWLWCANSTPDAMTREVCDRMLDVLKQSQSVCSQQETDKFVESFTQIFNKAPAPKKRALAAEDERVPKLRRTYCKATKDPVDYRWLK